MLSTIIFLCIAHHRDPSISRNHHSLSVVCPFLPDVFVRMGTEYKWGGLDTNAHLIIDYEMSVLDFEIQDSVSSLPILQF